MNPTVLFLPPMPHTLPKIIIGIIGEKGAGKGTAVASVNERYHAKHFRFSLILEDILKRICVENSRQNLAKLFGKLEDGFGSSVLAFPMREDIKYSKSHLIIVEGLRRWAEIDELKKLPNFHLIAIHADIRVRYERTKKRGEKANEAEATFEQFMAEEKLPTELFIKEIAQTAEFHINNNTDRAELDRQIDQMMERILGAHFPTFRKESFS